MISDIKKILENYNSYHENYNFKNNVDFLLNCLNDNHLIENFKVNKSDIIINCVSNDKTFVIYEMQNYKSEFLISLHFSEIKICKDSMIITINNNLCLNLENILFDNAFYGII